MRPLLMHHNNQKKGRMATERLLVSVVTRGPGMEDVWKIIKDLCVNEKAPFIPIFGNSSKAYPVRIKEITIAQAEGCRFVRIDFCGVIACGSTVILEGYCPYTRRAKSPLRMVL